MEKETSERILEGGKKGNPLSTAADKKPILNKQFLDYYKTWRS